MSKLVEITMFKPIEFDSPSLRIGTNSWWKEVKKAFGRHGSEQLTLCRQLVDERRPVKCELRNDLSIEDPGWAVIFTDSDDFWALYFQNREDAEAAAKEWNEDTVL